MIRPAGLTDRLGQPTGSHCVQVVRHVLHFGVLQGTLYARLTFIEIQYCLSLKSGTTVHKHTTTGLLRSSPKRAQSPQIDSLWPEWAPALGLLASPRGILRGAFGRCVSVVVTSNEGEV